nr:hypothetical protein Iba_chr10aCG5860 [Ipomoea batatas]GME04064.1 hypothetical protein Iba_scaffold1536CG0230 [Ipomoea batatas]
MVRSFSSCIDCAGCRLYTDSEAVEQYSLRTFSSCINCVGCRFYTASKASFVVRFVNRKAAGRSYRLRKSRSTDLLGGCGELVIVAAAVLPGVTMECLLPAADAAEKSARHRGGSSSDLWLVLAALALRWEWETSSLARRDGWRWWETERREPATSYGGRTWTIR